MIMINSRSVDPGMRGGEPGKCQATHRTRSENRQDSVRLRTLLDEAGRRLKELRAELPRGQADELMHSTPSCSRTSR